QRADQPEKGFGGVGADDTHGVAVFHVKGSEVPAFFQRIVIAGSKLVARQIDGGGVLRGGTELEGAGGGVKGGDAGDVVFQVAVSVVIEGLGQVGGAVGLVEGE